MTGVLQLRVENHVIVVAHVEPSPGRKHLWVGRSRRLEWLPQGRAKWHDSDDVEQG